MSNTKIGQEAEQVLIGSLLGDGSLHINKRGINAYFRETHSVKQKDYLLWKKDKLSIFKPNITEYKIYDERTKQTYENITLWTKTHPLLTGYYYENYAFKKKRINQSLLSNMEPLALAVWYCDDGSYGYINQNAKIATYVEYDQNKILTSFLKEKFNLDCSINKDGKRHYIYFSVKEIKKFLNIIKDYIPECMNYKLGSLSDSNIIRLREENLRRRNRDKIRHRRDMEDPVKHALINRWHREGQERRLEDPEYRKKHNEYHKIWQRKYRQEQKEKCNNEQ